MEKSSFLEIIDSELELAELWLTEGGIVGVSDARRLGGFSETSAYIYRDKRIQKYRWRGKIMFNAVDCLTVRMLRGGVSKLRTTQSERGRYIRSEFATVAGLNKSTLESKNNESTRNS